MSDPGLMSLRVWICRQFVLFGLNLSGTWSFKLVLSGNASFALLFWCFLSTHFGAVSCFMDILMQEKKFLSKVELTIFDVNVLESLSVLLPPLLILSWHLSPLGWVFRVRPVSNSVTPPQDPWQHLHALRYCPHHLVSLSVLMFAHCPPSIPQRSETIGGMADGFATEHTAINWEITIDCLISCNELMVFHQSIVKAFVYDTPCFMQMIMCYLVSVGTL